MPAPYSMDLRLRIIKAYNGDEGTFEELSARFGVGVATVNRYVRRYRERGDVEPDPHAGGQIARIQPEDAKRLAKLVMQKPDATVDQLTEQWARIKKVPLSRSAMLRGLRRFKFTFKKSRSWQASG